MVLWRSQPLTPKQTRDRAATHPQPQLQHLALDFLFTLRLFSVGFEFLNEGLHFGRGFDPEESLSGC